MHDGLAGLRPYPFERLAALYAGLRPATGAEVLDLSIGEPRHPVPPVILDALRAALPTARSYPTTRGSDGLRESICGWLQRRYGLPPGTPDPARHVLPVNGTREALFAVAQCMVDRRAPRATVVMPNPLYQIYEGATLLTGARPVYLACHEANGFLPDPGSLRGAVWDDCQLLYLCSPGNPTGAVEDLDGLRAIIELADRHDFIIAADECYSEIHFDEQRPPPGLLQACASLGRDDFRRCLAFHSLSKRSNVPGMRSGFVAGDPGLIDAFYRYRTYHGCSMPPFIQAASVAAWNDEAHVLENRRMYMEKFRAAIDILKPVVPVYMPRGGFYLWMPTPCDDETFTARLYERHGIRVLPGSYLGREQEGLNPGAGRVRIALVAGLEECVDAARRIRDTVESINAG